MVFEEIFIGSDNRVDLILESDGVAVDLASVTKIELTIGSVDFSSIDKAAGLITWDQSGYATGEIRIDIGQDTHLVAGTFRSFIKVFDPTNPNGIVWGILKIAVRAAE